MAGLALVYLPMVSSYAEGEGEAMEKERKRIYK